MHDPDAAADVRYVCSDKRGFWELQEKLKAGDFPGIRNAFFHLEDRDENRARLFCYGATDIKNLLGLYCKEPPREVNSITRDKKEGKPASYVVRHLRASKRLRANKNENYEMTY